MNCEGKTYLGSAAALAAFRQLPEMEMMLPMSVQNSMQLHLMEG